MMKSSTDVILEAQAIGLRFGGVIAAENVNLKIHKGEVFGIIGQNGAGKSTFLNICTGYLKPQLGKVLLMGRDVTGLKPRKITALGLARTFQHPQIFLRRSVVENILFALACGRNGEFWNLSYSLHSATLVERAEDLLALCQLSKYARSMAGNLPEGARKILDVAMALALEPRVVLMDEPTSGVSLEDKGEVMDTLCTVLAERSCAVVFVEHDLEIVEKYADRVGVWGNGKMLSVGAPEQVLRDAGVSEWVR